MTCADFEAMPVSREAINIVYDALAESKSTSSRRRSSTSDEASG